MKLHIAADFALPIEAVTETFCLLARRGAGKTYSASVLAEEMLKAKQQIVALDPTGAWWGLRSGFPIVIMGGEHADVPIEETAGEVIAQAIVENRFSAVIDLSLFRKGQMIRFMVPFAETLYRLNREPVHLFVDEADQFAPQGRNWGGEENRMLGAMEDIVRRGRKRGIGCTLITQRPSVLNKNVLTQAGSLLAMRMGHPRDIDAIQEWIDVHAEVAESKEVIKSLPSLPIGEGWLWSPGWLSILRRIKIRKRETFDSSATPKPGQTIKEPRTLAQVNLDALGEQIKATVERAKANDPKALKRLLAEKDKRIAQLERTGGKETVVEKIVEVPVLKNGQLDRTEKAMGRLEAVAEKAIAAFGELKKMVAPAFAPKPAATLARPAARPAPLPMPIRRPSSGEPQAAEVGRGGLYRILVALAQRPQGMGSGELGVRAQLSSRSGTFGTYLSTARQQGWMAGAGDHLQITDAGVAAIGDYEPLPTGGDLLNYWLNHKRIRGGAARILSAVAAAHPESISGEQVAEQAGLSAGSGTFGTYLSTLRTLQLISGPKHALRASDELFGKKEGY